MLQPGADAPDIRLPDLDGVEWTLGEALRNGAAVALVFFKISCPTCQLTFPYLQRMADSLTSTGGANIIAISQDSVEDTREFQQRFGMELRTLTDDPGAWAASNAYGIARVPSFFVVEPGAGRRGTVAASFDGFNRAGIERIGTRFGAAAFTAADRVPDLQPG